MAFELPPLPYAQDALEPHISAKTLSFHYGKHHQGYVTKLNDGIKGSGLEGKGLEEVIKTSWREKNMGVFNNAAQVWNHTFFWHSMKPNGGGVPPAALADEINKAFGSADKLKEELKQAAVSQFGSGWAWLVHDGSKLSVLKTPNAENPMVHSATALFTVDVWEHAYYLDYQNKRPEFVTAVLDHLINWDFIAENLQKAR